MVSHTGKGTSIYGRSIRHQMENNFCSNFSKIGIYGNPHPLKNENDILTPYFNKAI